MLRWSRCGIRRDRRGCGMGRLRWLSSGVSFCGSNVGGLGEIQAARQWAESLGQIEPIVDIETIGQGNGGWAIDLISAIMWPLFDSEAYVGYFGGE
jgi:hypothetical protein